MANPLPEPQETQARELMKDIPQPVKHWIGHHLNNSLQGLSGIMYRLKSGTTKWNDPQAFSEILEHMVEDVKVLTEEK